MTPDLSALEAVEAWEHFGTVEADALELLRATMGSDYSASPSDDDLQAALVKAVAYLEEATGRVFTARSGELSMDGTGTYRLFLPLPVVSTGQDAAGGVSKILIGEDTTALDSDFYVVHDGVGLPGRDPRDHPVIDLVSATSGGSFVSRPVGWPGSPGRWPEGVRNVHVTALWGYVDRDGQTPALARQALAGLTVRALTAWDDQDELDDLHLGAVQSEATRDRSVSYGERAGGGGITTNRELDLLIARLRAPRPPSRVRPPNRRPGRRPLLGPVRGSY